MITEKDLARMMNDVDSILNDWAVECTISTPLPLDLQPGWNPIMRELSNTIPTAYEVITTSAEVRKKDSDSQVESDVAGDRITDRITINIMLTATDKDGNVIPTTVTYDSIIQLGGYEGRWRVITIKPGIGEIMVKVDKIVGD